MSAKLAAAKAELARYVTEAHAQELRTAARGELRMAHAMRERNGFVAPQLLKSIEEKIALAEGRPSRADRWSLRGPVHNVGTSLARWDMELRGLQ